MSKTHRMASLSSIHLECPISKVPMRDPVKAPDGYSYERAAITQWLSNHTTSPMDPSRHMSVNDLVTDYTLRSLIEGIVQADTESMGDAKETFEMTASVCQQEGLVELCLEVPDGETGPLDVAFVIDISGSMSKEQKASTGEADGFSTLDVVKHAVLTSLLGLRDCDRATIIAYSSTARMVLPRSRMDESGKARAKVALAGLSDGGSTNIWGGLQLAMEHLPQGGHIMLFTDGCPNIRPSRGEVHALKSALALTSNPYTVHTYGFGYDLDSELLYQMARATQGTYSFIPDIGMVGTIFVNAMANMRTLVQENIVVHVKTTGTLEYPDAYVVDGGYQLSLGHVTRGQAYYVVFSATAPCTLTIDGVEIEALASPPSQAHRVRSIVGIERCFTWAKLNVEDARKFIASLVDMGDVPIWQDYIGQIREAIEPSAFRRWGRHYLPSLYLAHLMQRCNNFLDQGVQQYGGTTFHTLRDQLDHAFNSLPAPTPTHRRRVVERCRSAGRQVTAQPTRMASYNSSSGPCFAPHCEVLMGDGSRQAVMYIKQGDVVKTSKGPAKVRCVLKSLCRHGQHSFVNLDKLRVTPWHPVYVDGKWQFPAKVGVVEDYECDAVYSFLLEAGFSDMYIEDIACITLAHGLKNDSVASHAFYGTNAVVEALSKLRGWDQGLVELCGPVKVIRDGVTGLVCGLVQQDGLTQVTE